MKKLVSKIVLAIAVITIAGCQSKNQSTQEKVSFYNVPLVCGAAPDIGCGSRIKPLFIETEKEENIKESWTNRQGTVIAIVWNGTVNFERMNELFAKNDIDAELITDTSDLKELNASFRDAGKWLKGMDVDKLSIEEATVIANKAISFALDEGLIDSTEATKVQYDLEAYFKDELVKVRSLDELHSQETQGKWQEDAYQIFVKYIGKERADKLMTVHEEKMSEVKECE